MSNPMDRHATLMHAAPRASAIAPGVELETWQPQARATLGNLLGLPLERCDAKLRILSQSEAEGYTQYDLAFHTEPEYEALACLRIPKDAAPGTPVVICLQGHSKGMHISLGEPKYEGDERSIAGGDRDFARQIIAQGYAALALEQRAFGACGGTPEGPSCYQPAMSALLLGRTLVGERVWDVSRAIDMLEAHFPQLDTARVAVMGNSGGGTTTVYAAAYDTRIAAAMPSCAFCGFAASIGLQHHCSCNYVPGILQHFDMGDLAGLIAPRPLVIINGKDDGIFPLDSALEQFALAQSYYALAHAQERCQHITGPEGHRFYAALGWPVFNALTGWKE